MPNRPRGPRLPGIVLPMTQPDDLEPRVSALETQVGELNQRVRRSERDAADARVLAGGADRDVAEIRAEIRDFRQATTSSFNAMREDLTDIRQEMNDRFAEVHGKFGTLAAGQQHIVDLLNTLIARDDGQLGGA